MAKVVLDVEGKTDDDLNNPHEKIAADHGKSSKHVDLAFVSFRDSDNLVRGEHIEGPAEEKASDGRKNEDNDHIKWQHVEKDQTSSDDET